MSAPTFIYPPPTTGGTPVGGSGTPGTIPVWNTGTTLTDSQLVQSATAIYTTTRNFGVGTATLVAGSRVDAAGTSVNQSGWGLIAVRSSDAMGADKGGSISFGGLFDATTETHWAQISGRKENGTSGQYGGYLAFATRTNGVGFNAERMRIDSTGYVGIGTVSPVTKLDVADANLPSGVVGIRSLYTGTITANAGGVLALGGYFTGTSPTTFAYIVGGKDNATAGDFGGHLQFITRPNGGVYAERARIDSAGNFGVATSTMVAPGLTITDPTNTNNIARLNLRNTNSDGGNRIATVGYSGNAIQLFTASETTGTANNLLALFQYNNAIFYTGTTATNPQERARIDSAGNFILNSATTNAVIQASGTGQGLKLPATPGNADTQTLDCYEENTWTPTRAGFGGTNPTVTASYTRVGRLVTITVRMVATGGAQYSGTSPTTTLSLPATITPAANTTASSIMVYGDTTTVGTVTAWNDGFIYLPTFALTTQQTAFSITYRV